MKAFFTAVLFALALLIDSHAQKTHTLKVHRSHVTIELGCSVSQAQRGQDLFAYLEITPDDGWYTYWVNPGTAGAATTATVTVSDGATVETLKYPVPEVKTKDGLDTYSYSFRHYILIPIKLPKTFSSDTLSIKADISWMACNENECIPGNTTLSLPDIPVVDDIAIATRTPDGFDNSVSFTPLTTIKKGSAIAKSDHWLISIQDLLDEESPALDLKEILPITQNIIPIEGERTVRKKRNDLIDMLEIKVPRDPSGGIPDEIEILLSRALWFGHPQHHIVKVVTE